MYRTDKIQCYFPLLSQGEDTAWCALNMYYGDLVLSVSSIPTYYYRYNNTSITRTKGFSLKKFTDSAKALFCYMFLFREYGSLSDSASLYRMYDAYLKFKKYDSIDFANAIRCFIVKNYNIIIDNHDVEKNIKNKLKILIKYEMLLCPRYLRDRFNRRMEENFPRLYCIMKNK